MHNREQTGRKILVCVAWPYASGVRHVGHMSTYIPSDVFARYHRMRGDRVLMVSGSDEHGTPITLVADKEGKTPEQVARHYHTLIKEGFDRMGMVWENYTETHTENHAAVTQRLFLTLLDAGYLFTETTDQMYDPAAGRFLPDRYVEGTCPNCGYPDARGDQCDNCGRTLDPTDLIDPRSKITGATPELRTTEQFFLDLPKLQDRLLAWVETHDYWRPNVRRFTENFIREGLKPRAITRDLDWGVEIPVEGAQWEHKRIYVWFDAVIGYLSASIEWAEKIGQPDAWRDMVERGRGRRRAEPELLLRWQRQRALSHDHLAGDPDGRRWSYVAIRRAGRGVHAAQRPEDQHEPGHRDHRAGLPQPL